METIFDYIESKYGNNPDYMSVLNLLPYAVMGGGKKALNILISAEKKGKKFKAYYPAFDKLNLSKYKTIGTIPDGVLLIEK